MASKEGIWNAIKPRLNRILTVAESALPERQFRAFRKLVLDEFGNDGLGKDLERIYGEDQSPSRHGTGGNISARKEVPR